VKWTEALVVERLRAYYAEIDAQYGQKSTTALLTQVPAAGRVIDLLALTGAHVDRIDRTAIEIKVSRQDYRSEFDAKRAASWRLAHLCLYAAPAGLIDPASLPYGWGLIEVHETAGAELLEYGVRHEPTIGSDPFTDAMLWRCAAAEDAIRYGDTPASEVARLRHENDRMHGLLTTARNAVRRERGRVTQARSELLAHAGGEPICADCRERITWQTTGAKEGQWSHVDAAHGKPCATARAEADRRRKEAETGAKYQWGFPPPIEPSVFRDQRLADERMESAS
jgi:hypothetical protein